MGKSLQRMNMHRNCVRNGCNSRTRCLRDGYKLRAETQACRGSRQHGESHVGAILGAMSESDTPTRCPVCSLGRLLYYGGFLNCWPLRIRAAAEIHGPVALEATGAPVERASDKNGAAWRLTESRRG